MYEEMNRGQFHSKATLYGVKSNSCILIFYVVCVCDYPYYTTLNNYVIADMNLRTRPSFGQSITPVALIQARNRSYHNQNQGPSNSV